MVERLRGSGRGRNDAGSRRGDGSGRRGARFRLLALVVITAVVSSGCVFLARVSVRADGSETLADVFVEAISGDGRYIVLRTNGLLDPVDLNGFIDLYRKDTLTGALELITSSIAGGPSDGNTRYAEISDDGSFVLYRTEATNLVPGDTNGEDDLVLHEMATGQRTRITVDQSGTQLDDGVISFDISGDGGTVAWATGAQVTSQVPSVTSLYRTDVATGVITAVSVAPTGELRSGGQPSVNVDGSRIAFVSGSADLVPGDTNGVQDTFVAFVGAGIARVSTSASGVQATLPSFRPSISGNGLAVAFETDEGLDPADSNGVTDIYVKTVTGATILASVADDGSIGSGVSFEPRMNGDGTLVGFLSYASEITGGGPAAVVRDGLTERTTIASRNDDGTVAEFGSGPEISADGNYVAWSSALDVITPDPDTFANDVFLRWWSDPVIDRMVPGTVAAGSSTNVTIEGSGFRPGALVFSGAGGGSLLTFSNVTWVDADTITATITVAPGTAAGDYSFAVQSLGTGPGTTTGSFTNCQCIEVTP